MKMRIGEAIIVFSLAGSMLAFSGDAVQGMGRSAEQPVPSPRSYLLGVRTSLDKVIREAPQPRPKSDLHVSIQAAGNEYEHFQIVLFASERDLENIGIQATPLICDDHGTVLDEETISFYRVGYVETKKPVYDVDYIGWYPDPLIPLERMNVRAGDIQPVWVTVHVPGGTPAGLYQGRIKIHPENEAAETIELSLNVWEFAIPEESSLQLVFSLYENCIQDYYQLDEIPSTLLRQYYSFLLAHRINPTNLYLRGKPQPRLEDFKFCASRGLNAMNIAYLYDWDHNDGDKSRFSEEFKRNMKVSLVETIDFLREQQWKGTAFVYGPDEPNRQQYNAVKEMFALVKSIAPDIRTMLTEAPVRDLHGYVDIWVPRIDDYDESECRQRQEMGEEIWWYVCAAPHHPYPNFFVDYPAIDHRILFWLAWKHDVSGFLYYSLNRWMANYPKNQSRWPEIPWNTHTWGSHNGDGQLIYPGPEGEPYSSVRFEVIRDGVEDFEYLNLLESLVKKLAESDMEKRESLLRPANRLLASISGETARSLTRYTKDKDQLFTARERIAEEILRLGRILKEN